MQAAPGCLFGEATASVVRLRRAGGANGGVRACGSHPSEAARAGGTSGGSQGAIASPPERRQALFDPPPPIQHAH
eukprot:1404543-Alexandrium_andersonii.AAC.1